ncbi:non-heme iron oxygenase ferredoxin subunit [Paracoccus spongiarum]|uniref:Non-heme iron oxygenase ferredoxin subunit n=1 Tax=Paracoccus spongiarum TaxID=3064387 RepID=A0ABT9JEK2_9RHOB|nr:non-heme iron oxygenase ferredoxin subunit [Paracoccus sp. 2205BS29-5]MDP5307532.1 non-heme iron oxygenase ferredoxin subunit [Paracoccus sp. 2205BS29-5]
MTDRPAPQDGDWHDLIALDRLETGWVTPAMLGARRLAVYDTPSGIHVSLALCNHGGADLCDGYLDRHLIECPLHQGAFDVRDGRPLGAPATRPMIVFPARIRDGMVQVRMPRSPARSAPPRNP